MNKIRFTKMHGAGNDYIYVDASKYHISNPAMTAVKWSDRHKGIGSDGLVLIDKSSVAEADFSMRIFNADGSEALMCGNAARCIGKYLFERGMTNKTEIHLQTLSGIKTLLLKTKGDHVESVMVDMGEPMLKDAHLFVCQPDLPKGTFVSMGNPHYVIFTDDVDQVEYDGEVLEYHSAFPQRSNIEFVKVVGIDQLRVRVWERGSGITMACGTGACAVAVAAALTGRARRETHIIMDGGELCVEWRETDNHLYLSGPAEFAFEGEIGS